MTLAAIIEILLAILKFPGEISAFVKLLQGTSEEERLKITQKVQSQLDAIKAGDRPSWD